MYHYYLVLNTLTFPFFQLAVPESKVSGFGMTLPGPGVTDGQVNTFTYI